MGVYELHARAKQVQRSTGRSSVAAAAYRSASRLYDERTGLWHDYTDKGGVEHNRLYVPEDAPDWARQRSSLWNTVEAKENRSNSTTAHELEIAFPAAFNAMQRREAGDAIARELMRRYGCAVDMAYHAPSYGGDERNYHAHILFTTRALDAASKDGWAKNKYRDLSSDKITLENGEQTTRGKEEVRGLRAFVAGEMNRIAERDRLDVYTEHLSFEARGIDKEPTQHMGAKATAMDRRGEETERGEANRDIQAANDNRDALEQERQQLEEEHAQALRELEERIEQQREKEEQEARRAEREQLALEEAEERRKARSGLFYRIFRRREYLESVEKAEAAMRSLVEAQGRLQAMRDTISDTLRHIEDRNRQYDEEKKRLTDLHHTVMRQQRQREEPGKETREDRLSRYHAQVMERQSESKRSEKTVRATNDNRNRGRDMDYDP